MVEGYRITILLEGLTENGYKIIDYNKSYSKV